MVLHQEGNRMIKIPWRVWLLIAILFLSLLSIFGFPPTFLEKGVVIKSVEKNSTSFNEGLRQGQIVQGINSIDIRNLEDYQQVMYELFLKNPGEERKVIVQTNANEVVLFISQPPNITVSGIPLSKIKTGLDLQGGARALIRPVNISISSSQINDLISVTIERLNVYGLSDITIRSVKDLQGNNYMLIEIAGATPSDLRDLIGQQGKFEAKIGNETVFIGGNKDISHVCRDDATCARIESCFSVQGGGYSCRFSFGISLTEQAAKRQADITNTLGINSTESGNYLDKNLDLYLDNLLVESLRISSDLKGKATTQISIQGSGQGPTEQEAVKAAQADMKKLQTILITGSLPFKLEIVKLDTISPVLGKEFTKNIFILGLIVFSIISIVLFIKYRKIKITLAVVLTMFSEAFITLAIAALIKWNLDAPSIAGIIAGMGTGVNDQIVIIDESISNINENLGQRIKRAFFIIIGAFFTIIAAMLPLFWAGAGMLRGFALTTIISVVVGILITRPAFSDILKKISER